MLYKYLDFLRVWAIFSFIILVAFEVFFDKITQNTSLYMAIFQEWWFPYCNIAIMRALTLLLPTHELLNLCLVLTFSIEVFRSTVRGFGLFSRIRSRFFSRSRFRSRFFWKPRTKTSKKTWKNLESRFQHPHRFWDNVKSFFRCQVVFQSFLR